MKVLVSCESSGTVRDAFRSRGHDAYSCDLLPADEGTDPTFHIQGDVREILYDSKWDLTINHPPCTYLNVAAAWAFKDPDFKKYPGVGYHQKIKPGTLTGQARRDAKVEALAFVQYIMDCPAPRICVENPVGAISSAIRKPEQWVQPYDFGDDASKQTGLWLDNLPPLVPTNQIPPRWVCCNKVLPVDLLGTPDPCPICQGSKKPKPRWANQTDSGQNKLGPSDDRWKERSKTYQGIADAMAEQWGALECR